MEETNNIKQIFFNITNPTTKKKDIKKKNIERKEKNKKRVICENLTFHLDNYLYDNQLKMIKSIKDNNCDYVDDVSKIALQQINRKIYGYKQQDITKNLLDVNKLITMESVINKMLECELKCYYCLEPMNVLYDISREGKQWSVDRIDNDLGHNLDNYYLACLECNLKRRRRNDDKFLFTKQLKIKKVLVENNN